MRVVVTGAGSFIEHHLVKRLKSEGHWVRAVDVKYPDFEESAANAHRILRHIRNLSASAEPKKA